MPKDIEDLRRPLGWIIPALILANAPLAVMAIWTRDFGAVASLAVALIVAEAAVMAWFARRVLALLERDQRDRQAAAATRAAAEAAAAELVTREAENRAAGQEQVELQQAVQDQRQVIEALRPVLQQLASGDLNLRLEQSFPPDYENLRRDFNAAAENLREAWRSSVDGAATIRADANQLVVDTDAILRRSGRQARSFGEAFASLGEIATAIKHAADEAPLVRQAVAAARADAESCRRVVRRGVEAMSAVERMLRQAAQLVAVVDEIAFQINLLSLNAGIEAARVGDAGRDFAAIAAEVRALAQRSTEAAEDIQRMLAAAGSEARGGEVLVAEPGRINDRILGQLSEIQRAIEAAASGGQAHAAGLSQIEIALGQVGQWARQNQSELESSAGMARRLVVRSEDLAKQALSFTLGEGGDARAGRSQAVHERPRPARPNLRIVRREEPPKDR
jgi:methyl-accepting chemotaxis protein